ncbi:hypothetical protein VU07_05225 [Desulfobulbus sp. F4]|nr:hypothetical protein [Desulfobulbus sp. F4]
MVQRLTNKRAVLHRSPRWSGEKKEEISGHFSKRDAQQRRQRDRAELSCRTMEQHLPPGKRPITWKILSFSKKLIFMNSQHSSSLSAAIST